MDKTEIDLEKNAAFLLFKKKLRENEVTAEFEPILDKRIIKQYFIGRKKNANTAFNSINSFFHIGFGNCANYILNHDPRDLTLYDTGATKLLRSKDKLGRTVFLLRARFWDPTVFNNFDQIVMHINYYLNVLFYTDENVCSNGMVVIMDYETFGLKHLRVGTSLPVFRIQELFSLFLKANPMRLKAVHVINHGKFAHCLVSLGRSVLPTKMKKRIFLHTDQSSLNEHVLEEALPITSGGMLAETEAFDNDFRQRLIDNAARFMEMQQILSHSRRKFKGKHKTGKIEDCPGCSRD